MATVAAGLLGVKGGVGGEGEEAQDTQTLPWGIPAGGKVGGFSSRAERATMESGG